MPTADSEDEGMYVREKRSFGHGEESGSSGTESNNSLSGDDYSHLVEQALSPEDFVMDMDKAHFENNPMEQAGLFEVWTEMMKLTSNKYLPNLQYNIVRFRKKKTDEVVILGQTVCFLRLFKFTFSGFRAIKQSWMQKWNK